jgi:adenosylhomocysteine nucleosidase
VSQHKFIILTALKMEARAVAEALGGKFSTRSGAGALPPGFELHVIGIGGKRLLPEVCRDAGGIILAGVAGGLEPGLRVGDVVIDGTERFGGAETAGRRAKIACASQVVSTREQKRELFEQTGAAAVDMESDAVRKIALDVGIPLLIVRAISDSAEDEIPAALFKWIDEFGQPFAGKVAAGIVTNPALVPAMIRLGRNAKLATSAMAGAVHSIVQALAKENIGQRLA